MKKTNLKSAFSILALSIGAGLYFVSCSNSEDLSNELTPKEGMGIVSFSINEKDYEPSENVTSTRVASLSQPEIQDLGDGWQAEVSLVPDTTRRPEQKVATRAIYGNKHYTIRAYQGSTLKGEIKGTFNGNNFTPDAGDPGVMQLPHGYYDFVCFNDRFTANGTTLTVNRTNVYDAFYTIERGVLINQDPRQMVAFTAKHIAADVSVYLNFVNCNMEMEVASTRYEFIPGIGMQTYYKIVPKDPANQIDWTLKTAANDIPEKMTYDFFADTYTYPQMGQLSSSGNTIGAEVGSAGGRIGWHEQDLVRYYWLPTTDCSKLKLTFNSGELYGRSLTGKSITVPTHKLVEANKRYKISIRLIMENMYLFSDGTKGFLDKNPGKTAIGVIISPMDNFAVALKDVKVSGNDAIQWSNATSQESMTPVQNYKLLFALSSNGTVNSSTNTAIQAAQNMFGSRVRIPTFRDFLLMGSSFGKMANQGKGSQSSGDYSFLIPEGASSTGFYPTPSTINFPMMDKSRFDAAFTRVNGDPIVGSYWTDTECKDGSEYKQVVVNVGGSQYSISLQPKNSTAKIRPIIWF